MIVLGGGRPSFVVRPLCSLYRYDYYRTGRISTDMKLCSVLYTFEVLFLSPVGSASF